MFNLESILRLLTLVQPISAALPAFKEIFDTIVGTFGEDDQETLKAAYADLIEDNDAGHARLQQKLADAANR